jgi:hypothetical protein
MRRLFKRVVVALFIAIVAIVIAPLAALTIYANSGPQSGNVVDEAQRVQRDAASFPAADENYFSGMDAGAALTAEEIKGRNTWMVWTGGNDRFWNEFIRISFGNFDLLKILSSYPGLRYSRDNRFEYFGLINEPCFEKATGPNLARFGLWLDSRGSSCDPDPFENEQKYPGVAVGARGRNLPVGSFYGYATGIVGLRLFPNPDFDEAAQKAWNPVRFYTDPSYYNSKDLVRPYRVGMTCGFCHVGPDPTRPPADPENPHWENLSSTVGAQNFWVGRIFVWHANPGNFFFQLTNSSRPGALDTSLVSTDYMINPRTINAVYHVGPRLRLALDRGQETLAGGNLDSKQFNDYVTADPLTKYFRRPATVWTARVQKDGSDSIGILGALNRVYLNIGLFSEEWLLHFNAVMGGKIESPIRLRIVRENSAYWRATEDQTLNMARFLIKAGVPHRLADAPGGAEFLNADAVTVDRGKVVFAENCARCHSSKYPPPPAGADPGRCQATDYLRCWNAYWTWSKTDEFKKQMRQIVAQENFLDQNFLSNELRVPVTLLQTNLCSPLATNAIVGHVWEEFSSQSYKELPSVGEVTVHEPISGELRRYIMPAGGRGYTRPPSLVSIWSQAPFLLNNSLGRFESSPSVAARMRAFDDGIRQLLWPERREQDTKLGAKVPGVVDRTLEPTVVSIPSGYLPGIVQSTLGFSSWLLPSIFTNGVQRHPFTGLTTVGSTLVTNVKASAPLATFSAGAPVSGPGFPPGTRVVVFDAATGTLRLDRPASANGQSVELSTDTPDAGLRVGPLPAGIPINLLSNLELAPETAGFINSFKHRYYLFGVALGLKGEIDLMRKTTDISERERISVEIQKKLMPMTKCPDFVVNRGHYFGTDRFDEEPALSDADKEALIAFLKMF